MGALLLFFPELVILAVIAGLGAVVVLVWLLLHLRSFVSNTVAVAGLLLAWTMQAGFVGFIVYIAAWVFMFPVMAGICGLVGLVRTWGDSLALREWKRQARAIRQQTDMSATSL
jgi:hypothetical protein